MDLWPEEFGKLTPRRSRSGNLAIIFRKDCPQDNPGSEAAFSQPVGATNCNSMMSHKPAQDIPLIVSRSLAPMESDTVTNKAFWVVFVSLLERDELCARGLILFSQSIEKQNLLVDWPIFPVLWRWLHLCPRCQCPPQ